MKQVWNIFSPFLVYYAACVVVGNIFIEAMYEYPTEVSSVAALLAIPFFMWMVSRDRKKDEEAGIKRNNKAPLKLYGLVAGASVCAAIALNNVILVFNLSALSDSYQDAAQMLYSPAFLMQIVCLGIIFPIMEEYLFRGLIYSRIRKHMTVKWAIFISSLFFGMYHGNVVQAVYGMVAGMLLAFFYEKYGSMKAPILGHMLMNITSCVVTALNGFTWMLSGKVKAGLFTAVFAGIAIVLIRRIREIEEKSLQ